ncbi:hypothetical protein [Trujillonella endophytica]|uniref:Uncharacterized protein n=1 Tax=Trujillonella endophytica TaxID=673521 RepID=A0A1H8SWV1_9ACTN|nr:hypothetical protein [Trujillella endophytica]SEO82956.1 hypothetical protein SAMN05660991_01884 [Trujillella endophytica]
MTASTATAPFSPTLRPRTSRTARRSGLRAAWARHRADRASLRQYREVQAAVAGAPTPASAAELSALLDRR